MNYNVVAVPQFKKELKKLKKKYPSIQTEFIELIEILEVNPKKGIAIGDNCFKIRLSIKSKAKGKSGGARVITTVILKSSTVYLLSIFDKSDKENLTKKELTFLLNGLD